VVVHDYEYEGVALRTLNGCLRAEFETFGGVFGRREGRLSREWISPLPCFIEGLFVWEEVWARKWRA
jgi:hypothetical protein